MKQNKFALEIHQLNKTYANGVIALQDFNLKVEKGDFFALLGANGAGKSTTIGLISSLLVKSSGLIKINGYDLEKEPTKAKLSLGIVPQEINLNVFETCEEILISQAGYFGIMPKLAKIRAEELLKQVGLWDKKHSIVRHLSGGMKRRLMIARALMHKPELLILDEPTAGVDIEIRRSMWDFLTKTNAAGTTIILTTHYLEEAENLCKNIAILDKGILVENTTMKELLHNFRHQTFIFNTKESISILPDMEPFTGIKIDDNTLELKIENKYSLNDVFIMFHKKGITIQSMRNKTNRLEELFMDVINQNEL